MGKHTNKKLDIMVSLIIPVYNTEKYLRRCLDSVLTQSYKNFEVICIDDCSTDSSREILSEYKDKYDEKVHVIYNTENIGQGRSRMNAIFEAKGEYIFFVDSDDYIADDYIERYVSALYEKEYDVVVGGFARDDGSKRYIHTVDSNIGSIISYSHACCKMYRKQFLLDEHINFGDFRKGEDIYFSVMLVMKGAKHCFIDYIGYYYYLNINSTTRTMKYTTNFEYIISDIFDKLINDNDNLAKRQQWYLEYAYVAGMVNALMTYNNGCPVGVYMDKYKFFVENLNSKFKNYKKNKLLFRWQSKGPSFKCRIGVWVTMNAIRYGVDKVLYVMFAIINKMRGFNM